MASGHPVIYLVETWGAQSGSSRTNLSLSFSQQQERHYLGPQFTEPTNVNRLGFLLKKPTTKAAGLTQKTCTSTLPILWRCLWGPSRNYTKSSSSSFCWHAYQTKVGKLFQGEWRHLEKGIVLKSLCAFTLHKTCGLLRRASQSKPVCSTILSQLFANLGSGLF